MIHLKSIGRNWNLCCTGFLVDLHMKVHSWSVCLNISWHIFKTSIALNWLKKLLIWIHVDFAPILRRAKSWGRPPLFAYLLRFVCSKFLFYFSNRNLLSNCQLWNAGVSTFRKRGVSINLVFHFWHRLFVAYFYKEIGRSNYLLDWKIGNLCQNDISIYKQFYFILNLQRSTRKILVENIFLEAKYSE